MHIESLRELLSEADFNLQQCIPWSNGIKTYEERHQVVEAIRSIPSPLSKSPSKAFMSALVKEFDAKVEKRLFPFEIARHCLIGSTIFIFTLITASLLSPSKITNSQPIYWLLSVDFGLAICSFIVWRKLNATRANIKF